MIGYVLGGAVRRCCSIFISLLLLLISQGLGDGVVVFSGQWPWPVARAVAAKFLLFLASSE
jgi:hypothetical protein